MSMTLWNPMASFACYAYCIHLVLSKMPQILILKKKKTYMRGKYVFLSNGRIRVTQFCYWNWLKSLLLTNLCAWLMNNWTSSQAKSHQVLETATICCSGQEKVINQTRLGISERKFGNGQSADGVRRTQQGQQQQQQQQLLIWFDLIWLRMAFSSWQPCGRGGAKRHESNWRSYWTIRTICIYLCWCNAGRASCSSWD